METTRRIGVTIAVFLLLNLLSASGRDAVESATDAGFARQVVETTAAPRIVTVPPTAETAPSPTTTTTTTTTTLPPLDPLTFESLDRMRLPTAPLDELTATKQALRSLARRIKTLTAEAADLQTSIRGLVEAVAPHLLDQPGVGPVTAAQIYIAWSHPGRCRNEAAFARL